MLDNPDVVRLGPLLLDYYITKPFHRGDGWFYALRSQLLGCAIVPVYPLMGPFDTEAEALSAARAALAESVAQIRPPVTIRDLLGGPEWAGLPEALGQATETLAKYDHVCYGLLADDIPVLRRLAEVLKVTP